MKILVAIGLFVLSCFALFAGLEGTISTAVFVKRFLTNAPELTAQLLTGHREYTRGDPVLGWVNHKSYYKKDGAGPGAWIQHNAQGYRHRGEVTAQVKAGQMRALCSGDSFTYGYSVANDQTWCHYLGEFSGWETVNLGMNGYGIDQAFLRYRRESEQLEHQVHVFGFIFDDIDRIVSEVSFFGASKPLLKVVDGKLKQINFPVPDEWKPIPWIYTRAEEIRGLRSVQFVRKFLPSRGPRTLTPEEKRETTLAIFREMQQDAVKSGRRLVVAQLPTVLDLTDSLRICRQESFAKELDALGIRRVDVIKEFHSIPLKDLASYFIQEDGHYSPKGNRFVAERIQQNLEKQPSHRLASK